ncbi:Adenylate cyclase [Nesidiocoris tenuis]|uniref:Adenylate cyclase n=1 Tax=Nesidiocoris tenuis TaxID=355587 RepID=A0ABN7AF31_9HEMI|nr:Adenylate cyclase [Nesidiocoris tenuis]
MGDSQDDGTTSVRDRRHVSVREKFNNIISNVTVEPILLCYILPNYIANLATMNMNLEKACRVNLNYSSDLCDEIARRNTSGLEKEDENIQVLVLRMTYWQSVLRSSLPALLILFLGSFSDRTGRRKPFMLLPVFGELMVSMGLLLCRYFFYEWPLEVAGAIEGFFPAITGSWSTMFMAVFSYMGDVTSLEARTVRLGVVSMVTSLALPVGTLMSGVLYRAIGFYGVFSTVAVMYALGIAYGALRLKEARPPTPLVPSRGGPCGYCVEFFNPRHVADTFRVAFKSRQGNLRKRILLVMLLSITMFGPIHGEAAVGYLFTRKRFNWDEVDFSIYSTYTTLVNLVGTALGISILTHKFKMEDSMLGALAYGSKFIAAFFFAYTSSATGFYIVSLLELTGGTGMIAMRSIASKLVPSEELGKINSLFGVCEAVVLVIYQPLYSFVYHQTISTFPGAFFLVGALLTCPSVLIFLYLYYLQKIDPIGVPLAHTTASQSNRGELNESFEAMEM